MRSTVYLAAVVVAASAGLLPATEADPRLAPPGLLGPRRRPWMAAAGVVAGLVMGAAIYYWIAKQEFTPERGETTIVTVRRGDGRRPLAGEAVAFGTQ